MADYQELIKKDKFKLKIMLLGEARVGKTSIIDRLGDKQFTEKYIETIGNSYIVKTIKRHNQEIKVLICDSPGAEKFRSLVQLFLRGTQGFIFVYDITNRKSFEELENWMKIAYESVSRESTKSIIVGNKSDLYLESQVSEEEARDLAMRIGVRLYLSSAKENNGIQNIFETLINEIADDEIKIRGIDLKKDNRELDEKKGGCCDTKLKVVKVSRCERWLTCLGCRDCLRYCVFCCGCFKECFCGDKKCGKEAWQDCGLCISCLDCKCSYCCNLDRIDEENKCCHCFYCPKTKVVYYGDDTAAYRNLLQP